MLYLYKGATSELLNLTQLDRKRKKNVTKLPTNDGAWAGTTAYPFSIDEIASYRTKSETHSACLSFKTRNIIQKGFHFLNNDIDKELFEDFSMNANAKQTLLEVLIQLGDDFENYGNGYLEVVGIKGQRPKIYNVSPTSLRALMNAEGNEVIAYQYYTGLTKFLRISATKDSENNFRYIFHIKNANDLSQVYGVPTWLSCTQSIDINYAIDTFIENFMENNGRFDWLVITQGQPLSKTAKEGLKTALSSVKGVENAGKSGYISADYETEVKVVQLNPVNHDSFLKGKGEYQMQIIQSHGLSSNAVSFSQGGNSIAGNETIGSLRKDYETYIKPEQLFLETKLNQLFYNLFGINPAIKFEQMDVVTEKDRATINDIYLNQGVICPSYIRRTQYPEMTSAEVTESEELEVKQKEGLSNHDEAPMNYDASDTYTRDRNPQ